MEDIAGKAEAAVKKLYDKGNKSIKVKTNQIRKFLTAVNSLTNKITVYQAQTGEAKTLPNDIAAEVKYLKVKIAYQMAREKDVKDFENEAKLSPMIDGIGTDATKYKEFAKYVEALVAYHKFYGGKD